MAFWWSLLFGVTMAACFFTVLVAAYVPSLHWWLPTGASTIAPYIHGLFKFILIVTGFFFVLTETLLVAFMYLYGRPDRTQTAGLPRVFKPFGKFVDSQHKIELLWTIVPAGLLLFIAFYQIPTWLAAKTKSGQVEAFEKHVPLQVRIAARQFEWRIRYPSPNRFQQWMDAGSVKNIKDFDLWGKKEFGELDDVEVVNELHMWKDHPVLVQLTTRDVIHSFNMPHFCVKNDALPGKVLPVWFKPIRANMISRDAQGNKLPEELRSEKAEDRWDIACAELCGWGHYRMIGRVYVHETRDDFHAWLKTKYEEQHGRPK